MRFRTPATVLLRRAQLILMLATLVPTVLSTAVGIVLLAFGAGRGALPLVSGVLVLSFATTAISGYILSTIFVAKGASLARDQHDFTSLVSHELRTPLTSIRLFIDSLRDERLTDAEERRRCLDLLQQETLRLSVLVERLLSLSRLEAGRAALDRKPTRLMDIVDDGMKQLQAALIPEQLAVEVSTDDEDVVVNADRTALGQAIGNLLINAWKYSDPSARRISVSVATSDRHVTIDVSDNGEGIPRDEQAHIFDLFERGRGAVESGKLGTGLGLAIVRAAVRAHRGHVELHSDPGQGSTFRIKLRRQTPK